MRTTGAGPATKIEPAHDSDQGSRGIAPHVVDKLLNHVSGAIRGVAAVYNKHAYTDERRRALDAWARHLSVIVDAEATSNVIAFAR